MSNRRASHWVVVGFSRAKFVAALLLLVALTTALVAQDLPWHRNKGGDKKPRDISPREMLALLGVDASHWDLLIDGRPQVGEEQETLTKLLYRMPEFDMPQWERWCKQEADGKALAAAPREHHSQGYILRGRAVEVNEQQLLDELVPLYGFRTYYQVKIVQPDSPHPIVLSTRKIPAQWKVGVTLDEPVRVYSIFLKAGETEGDKTPLYFVASRLGWYPERVNETLGVKESHVWLAQRGMDVALWDEVRDHNGAAIGASESECFYQLLSRLKAAAPEELKGLNAVPFDLPALLTSSDALLGEAYTCAGTARRVQKVMVPQSFRERLGIDHYYEIDLFVPLGDQSIRLKTGDDAKDSPLYSDGFPTTFCVAQLPDNLEEGDNVRHEVRLKGIFYKLWAYQSDYTKQYSKSMRQPSPLLIGLEPEVLPRETFSELAQWMPAVVIGVIIAGVGIVWFSVLRSARGDKKFERQVLRKYTRGATEPGKIEPPQ